MLLPDSPEEQEALAEALAAKSRRMYGKIEFDWDRDGSYDHEYSDLSATIIECTTDRSTATVLPAEVNALAGFSSGELSVTLQGRRIPGEITMSALFDPYNNQSPVYGNSYLNLPVRYYRVLETVLGPIETPVFHGFVRVVQFDRKAQGLSLIAADHLDFSAQEVTLPLWAGATTSPDYAWYQADYDSDTGVDNNSSGYPIHSVWAVTEILKKSGRWTTPKPRTDCVAYQTLAGSGLPTVGHIANATSLPWYHHKIYDEWTTNPYGEMAPSYQNGQIHSWISTSQQVFVPQNGTSNTPVTVAWAGWYHVDFPGSEIGTAAEVTFFIEDVKMLPAFLSDGYLDPEDAGHIQIKPKNNGDIVVQVAENTAWELDQYVWEWETLGASLTGGWHYANVLVKFTNSNISVEVKIDGATQTATPIGENPAFGYTYYTGGGVQGGTLAGNRTNVVIINAFISLSHSQWYTGGAATAYDPNQLDIPLLVNGKPQAVISSGLARLAYIPDTYHRSAWETLKDAVTGEYGLLWMDEWGTVHVASRTSIQGISAGALDDAIDLTDDQLDNLVMFPSADAKRNTIVANWTFRGSITDHVYKQESALERPARSGSGAHTAIQPLNTVIATQQLIFQQSAAPPSDGFEQSIHYGYVSSVKMEDPTLDAEIAFAYAGVYIVSDQRSLVLTWNIGGAADTYVGSFLGGNQANWVISGRRYSEELQKTTVYESETDVDENGTRALVIGNNPWFQTKYTAEAVAESLLQDTVIPAPMIETLAVPADPRRQLFDIIALTNETGSSGVLFGQIMTKVTKDRGAEMIDELTLRIVNTPNTWLLGIEGASELGINTYLS